MDHCPNCLSKKIHFIEQKNSFICLDCGEFFQTQERENEAENKVPKKGRELFFSYGHDQNGELVERIKRDIEKRGHRVWLDFNRINPGDHWRSDILNGVLNSSGVVAFLSEHSVRNPGVCLDELKIAICVKGADIKTVLLEPENRVKMPSTLADIQWLDMSHWQDLQSKSKADFEAWYEKKFEELCAVIESENLAEMEGELHFLKQELKPYLNAQKEYSLLSKDYQARIWLEERLEKTLDRDDAKTFVIYGKPGSGKSAFSVNYSHYNPNVLGCFLCEWNREDSIDPKKLIKSIAFRCATKLPDYRSFLVKHLKVNNSLDNMSLETLFDFLLAYPLNHLVDGERAKSILVIDGLDEAARANNNELAEIFSRFILTLPRWFKFIFTTRPESSVKNLFQAYDSVDIFEDRPEGRDDVLDYLKNALRSELIEVTNGAQIAEKIAELSQGVFLYAELLVNDLKKRVISWEDLSTIPRELNSFYLLSMKRKFSDSSSFARVRDFLELLTTSVSVPENLILAYCNYNYYEYLEYFEILGAWIQRFQEKGLSMISFTHKSLMDWFSCYELSGKYYVDCKRGSLNLARYCRDNIEAGFRLHNLCMEDEKLQSFMKNQLTHYYVRAGSFKELEEFLIGHVDELEPYWKVWIKYPEIWDHSALLSAFSNSPGKMRFIRAIQREGDTNFLGWILNLTSDYYGISSFDEELMSIYIDVVHLSGSYSKAVEIASLYLKNYSEESVFQNEFLSMLSVRRIHNSMFCKPALNLLKEALALYERIDDRYPKVYNELIFLIGGHLAILNGNWDLAIAWIEKSEAFSEWQGLTDFYLRNARRRADYLCHMGKFEEALALVMNNLPEDGELTGRYEAYLMGPLGNIYTCMGLQDEALLCYEKLLSFSMTKGIMGWVAHAELGLANVNYKLGRYRAALDLASKAYNRYEQIQMEWGLTMSGALLSACGAKVPSPPSIFDIEEVLKRAERLQYGSCEAAIRDFISGSRDYMLLYFL